MESNRQPASDAETATLDVPTTNIDPSNETKQLAYTPPQIPDGGIVAWSTVSDHTIQSTLSLTKSSGFWSVSDVGQCEYALF